LLAQSAVDFAFHCLDRCVGLAVELAGEQRHLSHDATVRAT
jgi:hypothetical protein